MKLNEKIMMKVYATALGLVTTIAAHKAMDVAWKLATGEEPPEPGDPEVPPVTAFTWALASGLGIGAAQLAVNRFTARKILERGGDPDPKPAVIKVG